MWDPFPFVTAFILFFYFKVIVLFTIIAVRDGDILIFHFLCSLSVLKRYFPSLTMMEKSEGCPSI